MPSPRVMNLAEELSDYAHRLRFADLDNATVNEAKKRIVDALGCAIGAFNEPPVRIARSVASGSGRNGGSTMLGTAAKTAPDLATFVNGLMVRYFDFNDTYLSKEPAHPSDNLGATLSVGESVGASGRDLLLATVLAYEIQCRLCDSADIRHRGWDHVCYGLVSCALAAGKLMGLNIKQLTQAVNISLNAHVAMRQVRAGELSMWKGASFSNAARNAVFSAMLAKEGMTGPSPIFEGEMGFFKQVSGEFRLETEEFGGKGRRFKLPQTYIKYYPAEYHSQTAVWAALELRKTLDPAKVRSILIESHEAGYTILGKDREKWTPSTKETADHSLPYIVAMALLTGRIDNSTYSEKNYKDPRILKFVNMITVREDPALTIVYPNKGMPNRVTVVLEDGETLSREQDIPRGHPLNPMTKKDIEEKFVVLTEGKMGVKRSKEALGELWTLDRMRDIDEIFPLLKVGPGRSKP